MWVIQENVEHLPLKLLVLVVEVVRNQLPVGKTVEAGNTFRAHILVRGVKLCSGCFLEGTLKAFLRREDIDSDGESEEISFSTCPAIIP